MTSFDGEHESSLKTRVKHESSLKTIIGKVDTQNTHAINLPHRFNELATDIQKWSGTPLLASDNPQTKGVNSAQQPRDATMTET